LGAGKFDVQREQVSLRIDRDVSVWAILRSRYNLRRGNAGGGSNESHHGDWKGYLLSSAEN